VFDSETTSTTFLARVKSRDALAWDRFVKLYGPLIYRWARSFHLQEADSADIVQDVFGKVLGNLDDIRSREEGGQFRAWLWTVTRNLARNLIRDKKRHVTAMGGSDANAALAQKAEELPEAEVQRAKTELVHRLLKIIRTDFTEKTYDAFWRFTVGRQTAAEVASQLNISEAAVRQAKFRVLVRIRDELGEW